MNRIIIAALVLSAVTANAQIKDGMVGINTDEPRATMHIEPGVSESKGLIIPRITAAQMKTMTNLAHFGADHHAIITYLKEQLPAADRTGKLVDVADPGYYFYNHTAGKWQKFGGGGGQQDLRVVGSHNHLTNDAGIGGSGTNLGTGSNNIGIGYSVYDLHSGIFTGKQNIGIGSRTLASNVGGITGDHNIAFGFQAMYSNWGDVSGSKNIALGHGALYSNWSGYTGSNNIGIGEYALYNTYGNTGDKNIAIGYQAGSDSGHGNGNVFLGNSTLGPDTAGVLDNVVAIGHGISPTPSNSTDNVILLGNNDITNAPKIGMGTYKPQAKLDVNGGVRVGEDNNPCTYTNKGTIRFDNGTNKFQGCDGSNWINLH